MSFVYSLLAEYPVALPLYETLFDWKSTSLLSIFFRLTFCVGYDIRLCQLSILACYMYGTSRLALMLIYCSRSIVEATAKFVLSSLAVRERVEGSWYSIAVITVAATVRMTVGNY